MATRAIQPVMMFASRHLDGDLSLRSLANRAGVSPFHLHRLFSEASGETPKQFTLRLQLDRGALMLLAGRDSILDIALACGFQSHEVFTRAFRRRFGISPAAYRKRGLSGQPDGREFGIHAGVVRQSGPCIGLFHRSDQPKPGAGMAYVIKTKEIAAQPVLMTRRKVRPEAMANALAEMFHEIFLFAQRTGTAIAGQPLTRYVEWGPGLLTIEGGLPVSAAFSGEADESGKVRGDMLPDGLVATTTHAGLYDKLTQAHAAMQIWVEEQGLTPSGAPWESYVTDPADYPDPKDWKTEIFWPVRR